MGTCSWGAQGLPDLNDSTGCIQRKEPALSHEPSHPGDITAELEALGFLETMENQLFPSLSKMPLNSHLLMPISYPVGFSPTGNFSVVVLRNLKQKLLILEMAEF